MRIAVVSSSFPVLSQTFVLNQITALLDAGHEVSILAGRPAPDAPVHEDVFRYSLIEKTIYWDELHIPGALIFGRRLLKRGVRRLKLLGQTGFANPKERLLRAAALERLEPYDAILVHFGTLGHECQILKELGALKGPMATVFHGYDMSIVPAERGEKVYDHLLQEGDLFLPISEYWRRRLLKMGALESKIKVHHMGVDTGRFRFQARERREGEPFQILSVGRFVEKKGFDDGVRAFSELLKSCPDAIYKILGDGELRRDVESLAELLGVREQVHFLGLATSEEVQEHLATAHLLFVPSKEASNGDKEGIPVVLMEAMASGLPVVTTIHSGIPELVEEGQTGLLAPQGDWRALGACLAEMATFDSTVLKEMGRAGRQRVLDEFDLVSLNRSLVEILEELAAGSPL